MTTTEILPAGLLRRLAAMVYDTLLLTALLFIASAIAVAINRGQAVSHPLYYLSLIGITYLFFSWFWTHGGQTLGMRTWRLKLFTSTDKQLTWNQATKRFFFAIVALLPLGAGLFWLLLDPNRRALHDRLSATRIVVIPKNLAKQQ